MNKILVKYPTRSRPELFLKTLKEYIDNESGQHRIEYLISVDSDDISMTNEVLMKAQSLCDRIRIVVDKSKNKIEACNADIHYCNVWDIVILISDDMHVQIHGWDARIIRDMQKHYPDTNGCLWYYDGSQKSICTLSILGRKYYDRFGYIYHPSYKSFFCDNEFTEVATNNHAIKFINGTIIKHQHPAWGQGVPMDDLYKKNDRYWALDQENYKVRKENGFRD